MKPGDPIPSIKRFEELKPFLGEIVEVIGIYEEINGAKRPGAYAASGRACLRLEDGQSVTLERQEAGIRPAEEMHAYLGRQVSAVGMYTGMQTLWGDGTQASIVSHCLESVTITKVF